MKAATNLQSRPTSGFAIIDLLVLVLCLAILFIFPIKAISSTAQTSHAGICLNNHRQMISAWTQYSEDNDGLLPKGNDSFGVPQNNLRGLFAPSLLGYNSDPRNWDPQRSVALSALAPYIRDFSIWRCPSDQSTVLDGSVRKPRVRTISTSQVFDSGLWLPSGAYRVYSEFSEIVNPAKTWVTMDEHPDSINDAALAVVMAEPGATTARILDFPASFHENGATMSFADGRSEVHPWKGAKIRPAVRYNNTLSLNVDAADSLKDVIWLSAHTTVRR